MREPTKRLLLISLVVAVLIALASVTWYVNKTIRENEEKAKFVGEWSAIVIVSEGFGAPEEITEAVRVQFSRETMTFKPRFTVNKSSKNQWYALQDYDTSVNYRIIPNKDPKQIDVIVDLPEEGYKRVAKGIYRFEGDSLDLSLGEVRPTDSIPKDAPETLFMSLKRSQSK